MMPHPERCAEGILGNEAGKLILLSMLDKVKSGGHTAMPASPVLPLFS
jgi:hypothetical protein